MEEDEFLNSLRHCLVNYQLTSVEASCPDFKVIKGFNINTHASAYLKILRISNHQSIISKGRSSLDSKCTSGSTVFYNTQLKIVQKDKKELYEESDFSLYFSHVISKQGLQFNKILSYLNNKTLPNIIFNQTFQKYFAVLVEIPDGRSIRSIEHESIMAKCALLNQLVSFCNYLRCFKIDFLNLSLDDFVYTQSYQLKIVNTKIIYNNTSNFIERHTNLLIELLTIFFGKSNFYGEKEACISITDLERLFSDCEVAPIHSRYSEDDLIEKIGDIKKIDLFEEEDVIALNQFISKTRSISETTRAALHEISQNILLLRKVRNIYRQQSSVLFTEISTLLSDPGLPLMGKVIIPDIVITEKLKDLDIEISDMKKLNDPKEISYYLYRVIDSYKFKSLYRKENSMLSLSKSTDSSETDKQNNDEIDAEIKVKIPLYEKSLIKYNRKEMMMLKNRAARLSETIKNYKSFANCFSCKAVETTRFFEFSLIHGINLGDIIKIAKLSRSVTQVVNQKATIVDKSINLSATLELSTKKTLKIWLNEGLVEDFIFMVSEIIQSLKNYK